MASPCFTFASGLQAISEPRRFSSSITMKSSKKRPKRPRTTNESGNSSPAPARINVNSGTPSLRTQLKLIKQARATTERRAPIAHTSYRRRKSDAVAWAEQRMRREEAEALPNGKYANGARPLCYVDGYNVIGYWPRLRKRMERGDLQEARQILVNLLAEFTHLREWDVVVVFDAYCNDNPMNADKIDHSNLVIVYTGSDTADTFIERAVYKEVEAGIRQIWAVTNDRALFTYTSSKGAHHLSASLFVAELKRAKAEAVEKALTNTKGEVRRASYLQSTVDVDTRNALYNLRAKLDAA